MKLLRIQQYSLLLLFVMLFGCTNNKVSTSTLFQVKEAKETGLYFSNTLTPTPSFNMLKYMYFYNGAGVASGDFNNDGKIDLFFTSNQEQNKLYLNKGKLQFEDVTTAANIPNDSAWNTGVNVVDFNNDGLLDLYIMRVGNYEQLHSNNQLLICKQINKNGVPEYEDKAANYGLDLSGFGTQAAFLDYDGDGDLDIYIMNHSLRFNGTFNPKNSYTNTTDTLAADYLLRNDTKLANDGKTLIGRFVNVSNQAGISGTIISYGLGLCVADVNLDGWPDIYVGNDFHENDYLYINQKNGTFKDVLTTQTQHTSQFSMGVDVGDINNDAYPELVSMDMLPYDKKILKRSLGDDEYNLFNYKVKSGYQPQFSRNALQLNNGNNSFSEIGMYAGIEATDWSWASLWMDANNDGWKDLFVSNGIPKRLNDMDYISYVSNTEIQEKIRENNIGEKDFAVINKFPEIKLKNKFFVNKKDASFYDAGLSIGNDKETFSNGAVYADFDNDGDLDVVVNNINDPVILYENKTSKNDTTHWVQFNLQYTNQNTNALGAKIIVYQNSLVQLYEKQPVRGFMSSMEQPLHIGLGVQQLDSIIIVWPNGTYQKVNTTVDSLLTARYQEGLPLFDYERLYKKNNTYNVVDIANEVGLAIKHEENMFNEFDRELLQPFMASRLGPALAVADVNGDGLEDVFMGGAKFVKAQFFIQNSNGKFSKIHQPDIDADSSCEDTDAQFVDVNNDGFKDLIVASGGNEFYGASINLLPRLYLNDGKGLFKKQQGAFPTTVMLTASCIATNDFDKDGNIDLFIGAKAVPFEYGKLPTSYLCKGDGKGNFAVVNNVLPNNGVLGFITNAVWADINKNGKQELIITEEWGGIKAYEYVSNTFTVKPITERKGWWQFVLPMDVDGDGDVDLIAGNLGENNRFKVSDNQPLRMYYNDFDDNGKKEQIITYYVNGEETPFATKDELLKQLPVLKKKYLYAANFSKSTIKEIFGNKKINEATVYTANYFSNAIFINNGNYNFTLQKLPWQTQLTMYNAAVASDFNNDDFQDVWMGGNFFNSNIQMGYYDADVGNLLFNNGKGNFAVNHFSNYLLKGEVRHIVPIIIKQQQAYIVAKNNDSLAVLQFKK